MTDYRLQVEGFTTTMSLCKYRIQKHFFFHEDELKIKRVNLHISKSKDPEKICHEILTEDEKNHVIIFVIILTHDHFSFFVDTAS